MSSCPDRAGLRAVLATLAAALGLATSLPVAAQGAARATATGPSAAFPGIGRAATPSEVAAWDIDVRPDFKGLPKGSGTVARGMEVWEGKCASCHGIFGESNEVFSPIVGGTTKADIRTGRVARLTDESFPGRTTMMKLSSLASLWDYINRAMPWTAPKSLTVEEVYGVTAYILHMADVLPADFTLSDANVAQVQAMLPNRNGMTTAHHLWPGRTMGGKAPDVRAVACLRDCATEPKVASFLPDFARNAHGNLAEQNRLVGPQRGADTTRPPPATMRDAAAGAVVAQAAVPAAAPPPARAATPSGAPAAGTAAAGGAALATKLACVACHGAERRIVGPSFKEIATRYAGRADAVAYMTGKIKAGGSGVWGPIPMPAQNISDTDAKALAEWLAAGAPR
jgi:cytochrome c